MEIQNVSSSRLYNRLQSVNGLLTRNFWRTDRDAKCTCRRRPSTSLRHTRTGSRSDTATRRHLGRCGCGVAPGTDTLCAPSARDRRLCEKKHAFPPYARLTSTRTTLWHRRQRRTGCRGRDPPIFDLQGSSCVDDPQYFHKCFIFFRSAELLPERQNQSGFKWGKRWWILRWQWHQLDHYANNLQVAVIFICNAPSVQFLIQQLNKTVLEWQRMWHRLTRISTVRCLKFWSIITDLFTDFSQLVVRLTPTHISNDLIITRNWLIYWQ